METASGEAYKALGCDEFLDLRKEATDNGSDAALRKLRECVLPFLRKPLPQHWR